jgi:hypothetical protein
MREAGNLRVTAPAVALVATGLQGTVAGQGYVLKLSQGGEERVHGRASMMSRVRV